MLTNFDWDSVGQAVIDAIIEGGMVRADRKEPRVLIWKGNAAEQIGEAVRRRIFEDPGVAHFQRAIEDQVKRIFDPESDPNHYDQFPPRNFGESQ